MTWTCLFVVLQGWWMLLPVINWCNMWMLLENWYFACSNFFSDVIPVGNSLLVSLSVIIQGSINTVLTKKRFKWSKVYVFRRCYTFKKEEKFLSAVLSSWSMQLVTTDLHMLRSITMPNMPYSTSHMCNYCSSKLNGTLFEGSFHRVD